MSVGFEIDPAELEGLQKRLLKMSRVNFTGLLESLGAIIESQTRKRIQTDKTDSDGKAWAEWSENYAASHHGAKSHKPHPGQLRESQGHTILSLSGALLDSMQFATTFDEVEIGSNLRYAGRQNAARSFLGLSPSNTTEALGVIDDFLDQHMSLER